MSLRGVIASLSTGTYTVTRRAAPTLVLGRRVAGATTAITGVVASIQPVTGRRTIAVPEGYRGDEQKLVLTTTELRGYSDAPAAPEPDSFALTSPSGTSETWFVVQCERWEGLSGSPHWRAYLARSAAP